MEEQNVWENKANSHFLFVLPHCALWGILHTAGESPEAPLGPSQSELQGPSTAERQGLTPQVMHACLVLHFAFGKHKQQLVGAQLSVHITHLQCETPCSIPGAACHPAAVGFMWPIAIPRSPPGFGCSTPQTWKATRAEGRGGRRGGKKETHCSEAESRKFHGPPRAKPGGNPGSKHGSPSPPGNLWAGNYAWKTNSPSPCSVCPLSRGTASLSHGTATSSPRMPCLAVEEGLFAITKKEQQPSLHSLSSPPLALPPLLLPI